MTVILTACTMRKRFSPVPCLQAKSLKPGPLQSVGAEWRERLGRSQPQAPAIDVYSGRSIAEARIAATTVKAQLMIASAGLGLLRADELIPSYNITVSGTSADSILTKLPPGTSEREWWEEISNKDQVLRLVQNLQQKAQSLLLVSLPAAYLRMLTPLILSLSVTRDGRLRLFTGSEKIDIDAALKPFRMPYDRRLDGPDSPIAGTLGDFAQRALRHFSATVLPAAPNGSASEHAGLVQAEQRYWRRPHRTSGAPVSDEEVIRLIRQHWVGGRPASLSFFRGELGVACEQRRFSRLVAVVRGEKTPQ
ncbi:hypothetical protein ABIE78_005191 [Sinorhizobium fredii]|uniref:hypothetical protein n=1 Tax=Rhizobium fredii TaxID=380 RepID=UPI001181B556|nr:hypothetical protein [Sinorhizobium fredii]